MNELNRTSSPFAQTRTAPIAFNQSSIAAENDWTTFDSSSFNESVKRRRKKMAARVSKECPGEVGSWMNKPVNSDASWMPIAPPADDGQLQNGASSQVESEQLRDQRYIARRHMKPPRNTDSSSTSGVSQSRGRTNRVSSSASHPRRGRSLGSRRLLDNSDHSGRERSSSRRPSSENRGPSPSRRGRSRSQRSQPSDGSVVRVASSSGPPPTSNRRGRSASVTRRARSRSINTVSQYSREDISAKPPHSHEFSRIPVSCRPPRAMRDTSDDSNARANGSSQNGDNNIGRDVNFGTTQPLVSQPDPMPRVSSRKEGSLMEKLFGDQDNDGGRKGVIGTVSCDPSDSRALHLPERIHPRILLTATVYHNTASNLWITTINTNQRGVATNPATAAKHLKAFSFNSEREARESAIANAPPKMLSFNENSTCFICDGKFAVFRRASHCRNCGVCICNGCSVSWPSKMVPETYNLKKEKTVKICISCEMLNASLKDALSKGDYESIITLYGTGNVNLRNPFPMSKSDRKDELMYPIHCAAAGGKLEIVKWLIEERFCPIRRVSGGTKKGKKGFDTPILTSKRRSILAIAMANRNVDVLRYLVIEKNVDVHDIKDLSMALRALERVLAEVPVRNSSLHETVETKTRWDEDMYNEDDASDQEYQQSYSDDSSTIASRQNNEISDSCIICCDNTIDCVITPCGHQICCLDCSENIATCPVCNVDCQFIRVFKP
mmetsp:Transcript_17777/g.26935  ORF Transcript_17777/g.26935 Transcript_17777/m.26935 type:complete len:724 (-) Transcript_17777:24-2195(-)